MSEGDVQPATVVVEAHNVETVSSYLPLISVVPCNFIEELFS